MNLARVFCCFLVVLSAAAQGWTQDPEPDDFAEFEEETPPASTPAVPSPSALPDISEPDLLDVLSKKPETPIPPPEIMDAPAATTTPSVAPTAAPPPVSEKKKEMPVVQPVPLTKPVVPQANKTEQPKKTKKAKPVVSEDPNFYFEKRAHEIYKKFNQQPTSVEVWEKALGDRRSEAYQVQRGDTLWDLSQTFFGDAHFWPKIWSLNKDLILNPHEVDPRMTIQFRLELRANDHRRFFLFLLQP